MRICYISYVKYGAGHWVHTSQFLAALKKLHDDVVIHTPRIHIGRKGVEVQQDNFHLDEEEDHLREVRQLLAMFIRYVWEEFRILRAMKPDVVILRGERYISSILLCRLLRIPLLLENNAPFLERQFSPKKKQLRGGKFWYWLEKNVMRLSGHIMLVSKELKDHYVTCGLPPNQLTVVPNGVDTELFHPGISGERVRKKLHLEGKTVIGFSGNFAPWHGLDFLIDAVKKLTETENKHEIVLLLIGKPGLRVVMPELPEDITVVTGRVSYEEVPEYLAAVDIFVAPYPPITPFYFSPLKIFEAMAMGKVVVASAQGQICELITDEVNGLLYPPGQKVDFIKKIKQLIEEPLQRERLGKKGRETIESKFTWQHNANRILALCKQLAQQ